MHMSRGLVNELAGELTLSGAAVEGEAYFQRQAEESGKSGMKKVLRWPELMSMGIGATIGAGIFVVTGAVARDKAGPALCLSYVFSGLACLLSSFSYAEFASISPQSGSAYGYTKATMGTFASWVIGWDLVLEYGVSAAGVAQGWSKYFGAFIRLFGGEVPILIRSAPWAYDPDTGLVTLTGSIFDAPAVIVTGVMTLVLIRGIKESATINSGMVLLKGAWCVVVLWGEVCLFSLSSFLFPFVHLCLSWQSLTRLSLPQITHLPTKPTHTSGRRALRHIRRASLREPRKLHPLHALRILRHILLRIHGRGRYGQTR